jgi:hypothetical protein
MENKYKATIVEATRNMTARERLKFTDEKAHVALKTALSPEVEQAGGLIIENPKGYAIVHVENPASKGQSKEYDYIVVEDVNGDTYATGSSSFIEAFTTIYNEMKDEDEEYNVRIYGVDSKNFSGKFLTCSIV